MPSRHIPRTPLERDPLTATRLVASTTAINKDTLLPPTPITSSNLLEASAMHHQLPCLPSLLPLGQTVIHSPLPGELATKLSFLPSISRQSRRKAALIVTTQLSTRDITSTTRLTSTTRSLGDMSPRSTTTGIPNRMLAIMLDRKSDELVQDLVCPTSPRPQEVNKVIATPTLTPTRTT
jgi:hypothetical protein